MPYKNLLLLNHFILVSLCEKYKTFSTKLVAWPFVLRSTSFHFKQYRELYGFILLSCQEEPMNGLLELTHYTNTRTRDQIDSLET